MKKPYFYVACMPVAVSPTPDPEQKECQIEQCPKCNTDMWVSIKKREMRAKNPKKIKIWCGDCCIKRAYELGYTSEQIEIVDINRFN